MNHSFYSLWTSRSCSTLSGSLFMMTLIAALYDTTGSAAVAGAVSFVRSLAILGSSLSLPLWYRKLSLSVITKSFLLIQGLLSALVAFSLSPLSQLWSTPIWIGYVFAATVLIGYVEGCASAAANALYPRLVSQEKLVQANSLFSTSTQMLSLFGWTAGGILLSQLGHSTMLQLSTGVLLLGYLFIVRLSHQQTGSVKDSSSRSVLSGWSFLFRDVKLRIITWMDIVEGIASGIWIGGVTLVFVQEVLKQDEAWWGYINGAYCAGAILGGLITLKFANLIHRNLITSIIIGSFGFSLFVFGYAFNSWPFAALLLVTFMGPFSQLRDVAQRTYVQQYVPTEEQPDVFAAQSAIMYILFGLSVLFAGTIADLWGAKMVYIVGGTMYALSALSGLILKRKHAISSYRELNSAP